MLGQKDKGHAKKKKHGPCFLLIEKKRGKASARKRRGERNRQKRRSWNEVLHLPQSYPNAKNVLLFFLRPHKRKRDQMRRELLKLER